MADGDLDSLISAYRTLCAAWEDARAQWQDSVASEFERDCWSVLDVAADAFITATAELDEALAEAESVVADSPRGW